ncbi:right-handed parallel beta-helix repeat-containing protein [Mycobacterium sp. 4D054]|uniref:right-handed parallel beta-helix repeat-containing protein n=1 Tax=Mycobacterium sp. 4D054 TaxID=3457440 RepID=UPI003FD4A922
MATLIEETTSGLVELPPGEYDLNDWETLTHSSGDLTIVGNGRVKMNGGGVDFIKATGGSLTIRGIEFEGFSKLVAFNDNDTDEIDSIVIDRVTFTDSPSGGMIAYFPTTAGVLVNRLEVRDSIISDSRQGIHFQGRASRATAVRNEIRNTQHYSIRFGKDWDAEDWLGDYVISENHIHDQYNAALGSGHEANMVAVFGDTAVISGNILENLTSSSTEDCEGIYLKVRQFTVNNNTLTDVGMDEGAIVVKGHPTESGIYASSSLGGAVTGNTVRFRSKRDRSIGINVLRSDVLVSGNQIVGAGVNAVRISWRGPYENVTVENNSILNMDSQDVEAGGHPLAAILLFGYGRDIMVRNNTVNGAYRYGIRLENNDPASTRYVIDGQAPIGEGITIEANTLVGSNAEDSQGISVSVSDSGPKLNGLRIVGNKIRKFGQHGVGLTGQPGCEDWVYDANELADGTLYIHKWPKTVYLGGIEWATSDTVGPESTSKTVKHTIPLTVSPKLTSQDVTITPREMGASKKIWLSAINTESVQVAVDTAPEAPLEFGMRIAFNRVVTTS